MKQTLLSFFVGSMILTSVAFAQEKKVSGRVTGADGKPLVGVTIAVQGSNQATQTDANGNYTFSVPTGKVIVFRSVGFSDKTLIVKEGQSSFNVTLDNSDNALDEVVVVAYGTAKKTEITGSVATIGSKDLEKRTVTNVTSALAGSAPGISVNAGNGQPGTGPAIRLRGFGSMSASSAPLYVVDGSVFDGNIGDINSSDVESISILKDATSAALYGSRAGNGVIIITTKKGKGAPKLNAGFTQGISNRGIPEYDRVGTMDYYPTVFQALKNSYMFPNTGKGLLEADAALKAKNTIFSTLIYNPFNVDNNEVVGLDGKMNPDASLKYDDFDWYDKMLRTGKRSDANLSVSGSAEKTDYYVSLGYLKDEGYVIGSDFERFNGRVNLNTTVKSWLKTGVNLSASSSTGSVASDASTNSANSFINPFNFIRGLGSIYPVHAWDATGKAVLDPITGIQMYDYGMHTGSVNRPSGASPGRHVIYETMLNPRVNKRNLIGGRAFAEIKFLKDFTFTPTFSIDIRNGSNSIYYNNLIGDGATLNGSGYEQNSITKSYTFNQILSYRKSINQHNVSAILGHENYDYNYHVSSAEKRGVVSTGIYEFNNFVTPFSIAGYTNENKIESYFSKVSYNFDEKYYLDGSIRRDGSSIFKKENRWGTFFSLGGAWALSKENFMKDVSWVDDLRLKASFGQVGNNNILDENGDPNYYAYQALYQLGSNNGAFPGVIIYSAPNPDITWETSNTFNIGTNFSFFKGRLTGELEFYKRGSDKLLMSVPLPVSDAFESQIRNVGAMYNTGVELTLAGDIIRKEDFSWNLSANFTAFKNRITKMPDENKVVTTGTKRREVGKDYYSFWLRQYAGVDASDGSALYIPAEGTAAANIRTVNGKEYVVNQNFAKFDYSGSAIPDFMGAFTNTFNYKDFSLSFLITYQLGGKVYDSNYAGLMGTASFGKAYHADALNAWTTENTTSNIPRLDASNSANINAASTRWLIDASYISFRNVNFSYSLPKNLLSKIDVSSARIFFAGENLGLISKRTGMNPSEAFDGTNSSTYLPNRMFSLGINLSL
ncbi:TonB-dependent receptor [Sphingobacterium faecium]|uniref:SusC/RagA family TonB-linked outer membrane protein n=1 Tax=Sphingobacterium faecium TaxID=34087 RepID=UPI0032089F31